MEALKKEPALMQLGIVQLGIVQLRVEMNPCGTDGGGRGRWTMRVPGHVEQEHSRSLQLLSLLSEF